MKFLTFLSPDNSPKVGLLHDNGIVDLNFAEPSLPDNLHDLIEKYHKYEPILQAKNFETHYPLNEVQLLSPLPLPSSFRDFIAFETHLKNATTRFGDTIPAEWYQIPIFYFSNRHTFVGHQATIQKPAKTQRLDYELEIACIIGKNGKNIKAAEADEYIFGYAILNDWTARDLQAQEMKCMLGPAKGKDFATSLGPYIVTKDELEKYRIANNRFDMSMKAFVNGKETSSGNFKDIHYTFGQMIERASDEVMLHVGDVIGTGTVGWGCLMESGATVHPWLERHDEVSLVVEGLGTLTNKIV